MFARNTTAKSRFPTGTGHETTHLRFAIGSVTGYTKADTPIGAPGAFFSGARNPQ
jgi:hypothetical protein